MESPSLPEAPAADALVGDSEAAEQTHAKRTDKKRPLNQKQQEALVEKSREAEEKKEKKAEKKKKKIQEKAVDAARKKEEKEKKKEEDQTTRQAHLKTIQARTEQEKEKQAQAVLNAFLGAAQILQQAREGLSSIDQEFFFFLIPLDQALEGHFAELPLDVQVPQQPLPPLATQAAENNPGTPTYLYIYQN